MTTREQETQDNAAETVEVGHFVKDALCTKWGLTTTGRAKVVKPGESVKIECFGACDTKPLEDEYEREYEPRYVRQTATITGEMIRVACGGCGCSSEGWLWASKRKNPRLRQELRTNFGFTLDRPLITPKYDRKSISDADLKRVQQKNERLMRLYVDESPTPEFNESTLTSTAPAAKRCAACGGERTHYVEPLCGSVVIVCGTCDDERIVIRFNSNVLYGLKPLGYSRDDTVDDPDDTPDESE